MFLVFCECLVAQMHIEEVRVDVLPSKNQALCEYCTQVSNYQLSLNTVNTLTCMHAFKFCVLNRLCMSAH